MPAWVGAPLSTPPPPRGHCRCVAWGSRPRPGPALEETPAQNVRAKAEGGGAAPAEARYCLLRSPHRAAGARHRWGADR